MASWRAAGNRPGDDDDGDEDKDEEEDWLL